MGDFVDEMGVVMDSNWAETEICEKCGSTDMYTNDLGELVCGICGAQSQNMRLMTNEQAREDGERDLIVKTGHKIRFRQSVDRGVVPHATDAFTTVDFALGMQAILGLQCAALISRCGVPVELHGVVGQLWKRYLSRWTHSEAPIGHVVQGQLRQGADAAYLARLYADGHHPVPCLPLDLRLLLAILCVGCRWLGLPVMPHDVCLWVRNGTLVYHRAFLSLPLGLQLTLTAAQEVLMPTDLPAAPQLYLLMHAFALNTGVALPDVNVAAAVPRLVTLGRLPSSAVPLAQALLSLDELDRAHAPAYSISLRITHSRLKRREQRARQAGEGALPLADDQARMDPLSRLRSAVEFDGADYLAALVVMAVRLTEGWEVWVAQHLLPGFVGPSRATGAPSESHAATESAGGSDAAPGVSGPSAVDRDLPWTAAGLADMAVAVAASATGAWSCSAASVTKPAPSTGDAGGGEAESLTAEYGTAGGAADGTGVAAADGAAAPEPPHHLKRFLSAVQHGVLYGGDPVLYHPGEAAHHAGGSAGAQGALSAAAHGAGLGTRVGGSDGQLDRVQMAGRSFWMMADSRYGSRAVGAAVLSDAAAAKELTAAVEARKAGSAAQPRGPQGSAELEHLSFLMGTQDEYRDEYGTSAAPAFLQGGGAGAGGAAASQRSSVLRDSQSASASAYRAQSATDHGAGASRRRAACAGTAAGTAGPLSGLYSQDWSDAAVASPAGGRRDRPGSESSARGAGVHRGASAYGGGSEVAPAARKRRRLAGADDAVTWEVAFEVEDDDEQAAAVLACSATTGVGGATGGVRPATAASASQVRGPAAKRARLHGGESRARGEASGYASADAGSDVDAGIDAAVAGEVELARLPGVALPQLQDAELHVRKGLRRSQLAFDTHLNWTVDKLKPAADSTAQMLQLSEAVAAAAPASALSLAAVAHAPSTGSSLDVGDGVNGAAALVKVPTSSFRELESGGDAVGRDTRRVAGVAFEREAGVGPTRSSSASTAALAAGAAVPVTTAEAAAMRLPPLPALLVAGHYVSYPSTALLQLSEDTRPRQLVSVLSAAGAGYCMAGFPAALQALVVEVCRLSDAPVAAVVVHMEAIELMLHSYIPVPLEREHHKRGHSRSAAAGAGAAAAVSAFVDASAALVAGAAGGAGPHTDARTARRELQGQRVAWESAARRMLQALGRVGPTPLDAVRANWLATRAVGVPAAPSKK